MENETTIAGRKRAYWQGHVEQWFESGMTQAQYCCVHGLNAYQLAYWKKRFHQSNVEQPLEKLQLVPIVQASPPTVVDPKPDPAACEGSSKMEVACNGITVRLGPDFNSEALRKVLLVARAL